MDRHVSEDGVAGDCADLRHGGRRRRTDSRHARTRGSGMGIQHAVESAADLQHAHRKRGQADLAGVDGTRPLHHRLPSFLRIKRHGDARQRAHRTRHQTAVCVCDSRYADHVHRRHTTWRRIFDDHDARERGDGAGASADASHFASDRADDVARATVHASR